MLIEGCTSDKRHKCRWRALIKAIFNIFRVLFNYNYLLSVLPNQVKDCDVSDLKVRAER